MHKILVVEDTPAVREEVVSILRCEGLDAIPAENGNVAVELARQCLPDLVLCDILMPELDGYDVLAALRQDPATAMIPLVFLTAKAAHQDIRHGMGLGAEDYVTKPFTAKELLAAVRARLNRRAAAIEEQDRKLQELRGHIMLALPHELNTPLMGILGYADIIANQTDDLGRKEIAEIARRIHALGQRQSRIVRNFLIYAQIELIASDANKIKELRAENTLKAGPVVVAAARQKAKDAKRESDLVIEGRGDRVRVSEGNLKKIVDEVVDNAFKFSQPGKIVRVEMQAESDFTLRVSDGGRGMKPEQIANVGAYMQFGRKLHEQQGCGLGLIVAKRLTEIHGGHFAIEAVPDSGTMVCVTLPRISGKPSAS